jgi:hypothetical protein
MSMRTALVLSLLVLAGCRSAKGPGLLSRLTKSDAEVSSAPPRVASENDESVAEIEEKADESRPFVDTSNIALTDYSAQNEIIELDGATTIATVNSMPIFAGDVIDSSQYRPQIEKAAEELEPAQLNLLRARIIQMNLRPHIEKAALISALREDLKPQQVEQLDTQVGKLFEDEIKRLQKEFKVSTRLELEQILETQSTSLKKLKSQFGSNEMAMLYMGQTAKVKTDFTREELQEWYDGHRDQYRIELQAKWQQLRISYAKHGGKSGAAQVLGKAIEQLRNGVDFGDVCREFSDGPKAEAGGYWDWTKPESLADERVDRALFELPVGTISQAFETDSAYVLVRVVERQEAGFTPFDQVEESIKQNLLQTARTDAAAKVIDDLMARSSIWTIFDKPGEPGIMEQK